MFAALFAGEPDWRRERRELEELLTADEFAAARASVINAHYTSLSVVARMWGIAQRLGFCGGRVLEPSLGIGHFFGAMPDEIRETSRLAGVELDRTVGRMARLLYPDAAIGIGPFQERTRLDGFFDLVIGNVPFGDITIRRDVRYRHLKPALHNYFILRAVDEVKAGGLVLLLTSRYTMDAQDPSIRQALAEKSDLVAAYRLPCDAFKKNAGTEVVADILVLRRRKPGESSNGIAWQNLASAADPLGGEPIWVNEYFIERAENILGRLDRSGGMYGATDTVNVSPVPDFAERFSAVISTLPTDIFGAVNTSESDPEEEVQVNLTTSGKEGGYVVANGTLFVRFEGRLVPCEGTAREVRVIEDILAVRDALVRVFQTQLDGEVESVVDAARVSLNLAYDRFVARHGYLNARVNRRAFAQDPDSPIVLALEEWDEKARAANKAPVFFVNTVRPYRKPRTATSLAEAIGISLNDCGRVSVNRLASLLGCSTEQVERELVSQRLAFCDPTEGWALADLYLSGNVRKKLKEARLAAAADPSFRPNVQALELVQPADIDVMDIDVRLGSPWVPAEDVLDFAVHLIGGDRSHFHAKFVSRQGVWLVGYNATGSALHAHKSAATEIWGTKRANVMVVLQSALDDKPIVISDTIKDAQGREATVIDYEASAAANQKVADVREAFQSWIWEGDERRARLHRYYNDTFNNVRPAKYNGAHLRFPGMIPSVVVRPQQANAVWRIIATGTGLIWHEVGVGKTLVAIAAAVELRRLGLANKPAVVALKSNVGQIAAEARRLYPGARIISTVGCFEASQRKATVARIATGDWDLVILTHDHLDMLPMLPATQQAFIRRECEDLGVCIELAKEEEEEGRGQTRVIKRLEKLKQGLEERLIEAVTAGNKDDAVFFEQTGIDCLFVDEAHKYKSLPCYTRRQRVKGIPATRSNRATNMFMRARWLQARSRGRGVVFLTGTAVSNTMAELFINQRYLQGDDLEERGIATFDGWANTFGQVVTKIEYTAAGGFAAVSRFARFVNLPELVQIAGQVMDVEFADGIPGLRRPVKAEEVISAEMSPDQTDFLPQLKARARALKGRRPAKGDDNMLLVSTDARKSSLDHRLVTPSARDFPGSKVNMMVEELLAIRAARPDVAQVVFCDMGVTRTDWGFSLYADIISKLVRGGVPRELVFDFSSLAGARKEAALTRLREGKGAVAIGSTDTLGTGCNFQDRLFAAHHLDVPWLPAAVEQRDGRIWRHGNCHYDSQIPVRIVRYVTEGGFDAFMWQAIDTKTRFIRQVMRGGVDQRVFRDEDTEELSPAKVMAIASGNPALLHKVELEDEVKHLEAARRRHEQSQFRLRDEVVRVTGLIDGERAHIERLRLDAAQSQRQTGEFAMAVLGQVYFNRGAAGEALLKAVQRGAQTIGELRGFALTVTAWGALLLKARESYDLPPFSGSPAGAVASIEALLRNLPGRVAKAEKNLEALQINLAKVRAEIGKPFRDTGVLAEKRKQLEGTLALLAGLEKATVA